MKLEAEDYERNQCTWCGKEVSHGLDWERSGRIFCNAFCLGKWRDEQDKIEKFRKKMNSRIDIDLLMELI